MVTIYRDEQVNTISINLNISKSIVKQVITEYISYLTDKISSGKPVKFLNICQLRVNGKLEETHETLAYVSSELAEKLNQSNVVVGRILENFEESIIHDLKNGFSYNIRGLVNIKLDCGKVRIKKSSNYHGYDVRVITFGRFKRIMEV